MPFREETIKDHKERLNRVLLYIQENIEHSLSLETLSDIACFSPFHFHRIFAAYLGETPNDYIRRIRLEHAAVRLCHSEESITSIALAAGYETPAAFTKAFRLHFGKNPTEFKKSKKFSLPVKLLDLNTKEKRVKMMDRKSAIFPIKKSFLSERQEDMIRLQVRHGQSWRNLSIHTDL